jgi:hypothetical protein
MKSQRGGKRIVVYLRTGDVAKLESQEKDPAGWVRGLVRHALDKLK